MPTQWAFTSFNNSKRWNEKEREREREREIGKLISTKKILLRNNKKQEGNYVKYARPPNSLHDFSKSCIDLLLTLSKSLSKKIFVSELDNYYLITIVFILNMIK